MRAVRWALGGFGLAAGGYAGWLLTRRPDDLLAVLAWLAGGVIAHDLVLAPLVLGVCLLGSRLLPARAHAGAVLALAVFGSITLVAIPVLVGFGAKADNPTLLDRNYLLGWMSIGALTLAASVVVAFRDRRGGT